MSTFRTDNPQWAAKFLDAGFEGAVVVLDITGEPGARTSGIPRRLAEARGAVVCRPYQFDGLAAAGLGLVVEGILAGGWRAALGVAVPAVRERVCRDLELRSCSDRVRLAWDGPGNALLVAVDFHAVETSLEVLRAAEAELSRGSVVRVSSELATHLESFVNVGCEVAVMPAGEKCWSPW